MAISHLSPLLTTMFENSDVALLEFAEKAESNAAQQRFFEAMKEVRVKRPVIEQAFLDELSKRFRAFTTTGSGDQGFGSMIVEEVEFSLVEKDDMEERVAMQNMVSKALINYGPELNALRQRLALAVGGRKLKEREIPGGPQELAESFKVAARQLNLEPKIKIIVYVLFDKFVLSAADIYFQEYNNLLMQAGLLPSLKYEIKKQPGGVSRARRQAQGAASQGAQSHAGGASAEGYQPVTGSGETVGEELFDTICQLLAGRHSPAGTASRNTGTGGSGIGGGASGGAETLSQPMLVSALQDIQRNDNESLVSGATLDAQMIPDISLDTQLIEDIRLTLVQQRAKLFGGVDRRRVASADRDVIDLVGMMFEYMLNDESIPNAVKALLSRLHTPFLKVAILDKHFFTQEDHPARELLNAMADAGARLVVEDDLNRGVFPYMRKLVDRVMDEFEDELALFGELLAEFETRLEQLEHTAEITEQRAREAATGQEKLQLARQRAQAVIEDIVSGNVLPPAILQLLKQTWADKLMFILLRDKDGEQGQSWQTAIRMAEDIVWSTAPCSTDDARSKLREELPALQGYLRDGLELLKNFGSGDTERLFALLADSQAAALDPLRAEQVLQQQTAPAVAVPVAREPETDADTEENSADEVISAQEQEMLDILDQVEFGTWFEFNEGDDRPRQRVKLAWYTQMAGHYMFVDSLGVKAAVKARRVLARELSEGVARIVSQDKRPFVDRAMEAVRNLLRREDKRSA